MKCGESHVIEEHCSKPKNHHHWSEPETSASRQSSSSSAVRRGTECQPWTPLANLIP